ncbi:MAG: amidophosphoribosyltransferase [Bacteroidales bacterium]|nr:amidophosphoribosyltransferase [Bacteroidales bacterium]
MGLRVKPAMTLTSRPAYAGMATENLKMITIKERELNEECGIFATFNVHNASTLTYYGLHALQHRGQEGCGIASVNDRIFKRIKGEGLVTEVFNEENLTKLDGNMAIGHVLYSHGDSRGIDNVQPFMFMHSTGDFALAHNGSLVNAVQLKKYLEDKGSLFHSTSDSEILAHLIKKDNDLRDRLDPLLDALNMIEGAFAFVVMTASKIYAIRDKHGLKPLSLGKLNGGYVVSSETCAFDVIGAEFVRDIEPGEIVVIDKDGLTSVDYSKFKRHNMCAMEYIYFARPDSDIEGVNVHTFRKQTGKLLFQEAPVDADIVIGVPDSSLSASIGYSEASGIPYEMGLIKNKYVGRTFIQPSQALREKGVKMKLSAVRSIVNGKRVALIDDSIVRGTTVKRIVGMLKQFGAKEVHLRIASPEMTHPCFYGVETTGSDELISARLKDIEKIKESIGADSLAYLSVESLYKAGNRSELCVACFTGKYPTPLYQIDI